MLLEPSTATLDLLWIGFQNTQKVQIHKRTVHILTFIVQRTGSGASI